MELSRIGRWGALTTTVVFIFAGCAGAGTTASVPSASAAQNVAHRATSSSGDFVYYSGGGLLWIYTYPEGQYVAVINNLDDPGGMCADNQGDVFVTVARQQEIVEYQSGGTTPIATLSDKGYTPSSCAYDAVSGNLAVSNSHSAESGPGNIAIYQNAQGSPTFYSSTLVYYTYCTYDNNGNLFTDGGTRETTGPILAEMPAGSGSLRTIALQKSLQPGNLQWDGSYLTIATSKSRKGPMPVYRLKITGSNATIIGKTDLRSRGNNFNAYQLVQYWIHGNVVVGPNGHGDNRLALWHYRTGGKPFRLFGKRGVLGVTISVAPPDTRTPPRGERPLGAPNRT